MIEADITEKGGHPSKLHTERTVSKWWWNIIISNDIYKQENGTSHCKIHPTTTYK